MVEFHQHCANCVQRNCKFSDCSLLNCEYGCGAVTHQCKLQDHGELCPNKPIVCINERYGCKALLQRHKMMSHLAHCPASVVRCSFTWEHVDRNLITNSVLHHEIRPLQPPQSKNEETFVEKFRSSNIKRVLESEEKEKEFSTMVEPTSSHLAYPEEPYTRFCRYGDIFQKEAQMSYIASYSPSACCFYITTKSTQRLQLRVLMQCDKTLRRDEFGQHYKMQHIDIHSALYGWLVHHCPFYEYGCNFNVPRLLPSAKCSTFVYNDCSHAFTIKPTAAEESLLAVSGSSKCTANGYPGDLLGRLPVELLWVVMSYLDSSDLFCLSLASKFLRHT